MDVMEKGLYNAWFQKGKLMAHGKMGPSHSSWGIIKIVSFLVKTQLPQGTSFQLTLKKVKEAQWYDPKGFQCMLWGFLQVFYNLKADCEVANGEKEKALFFFNVFSVEHCNVFVLKQK